MGINLNEVLSMADYTTVRIRKASLEKINKMKGEDGSVADVIEKLLNTVDGCNIDDVIEVKRNTVAILLEYIVFDGNSFKTMQEYGITFQELRDGKVGDRFTAKINPTDNKYMLDTAEILFKDDRSVIVRIEEFSKTGRCETSEVHLEHIDLF